MKRYLWQTERDSTLAAEADGLRLVVKRDAGGSSPVRFLVLRRQGGPGSPLGLVASGWVSEVREGMQAAERVAARVTGLSSAGTLEPSPAAFAP